MPERGLLSSLNEARPEATSSRAVNWLSFAHWVKTWGFSGIQPMSQRSADSDEKPRFWR